MELKEKKDYDVLLDRIKELGLNEEDYWWYLELRKFGTATHSGFGLGFERIVNVLNRNAKHKRRYTIPKNS